MKLFLCSRQDDSDYNTYSDFVVAAETEEDAKDTHPDGDCKWNGKSWRYRDRDWSDSTWTTPDKVTVKEIGTAADGIVGVQCASFHAG